MSDEHEPSKRQPIASPPRKAYNAMGDAAKAMGATPPFSAMGDANDSQQAEMQSANTAHHAIDELPPVDVEYLREHGSDMEGEYTFHTLVPPAIVAPAPAALKPGWRALPSESLPSPTYYPVIMGLAITLMAWGPVTTLVISAIGLMLFIVSLGGWIGEMRRGH